MGTISVSISCLVHASLSFQPTGIVFDQEPGIKEQPVGDKM